MNEIDIDILKKLRVLQYKNMFDGLNDKETILSAYRLIINSSKDSSKLNEEEFGIIKDIVKATDNKVNLFKCVLLNSMCTNDIKYKELYKESLISYNKILENYKQLAKELKIDTALDLSHLFTYMLWNGYYSITKEHTYKFQERLLLPGMYSFDVIKDKGVCLAYADLLNDYLTTCDKTSALLECKVPTKKGSISFDYRPEINRNIEKNMKSRLLSKAMMLFLKKLINKTGNHAVTLIKEDDKIFVYDPTNLCVLNILNDEKTIIINGKGEYTIKPFTTILLHPNSDPNKLFEELLVPDIKPAYKRKEIIISFEETIDLIKNNINLLNDAYDNIHHELELINNDTNEMGGYFKALRKIKKMENNNK